VLQRPIETTPFIRSWPARLLALDALYINEFMGVVLRKPAISDAQSLLTFSLGLPMNVDEWMDRSFKNWLLVGASIFLAIGTVLAVCIHAAGRTSWNAVITPTFHFVSIQIAAFGGMYFARKYGRVYRDLRPGFLLSGTYALAMGLLVIHYSVGWGLMSRAEQHSNFIGYTIVIVCVTLILIFLRLPSKL